MAVTLVVENGTFVANANTYVNEVDSKTYHADRGNVTWASAEASERKIALIRAAFVLENKYLGKWIGVKTQSWKDSAGDPATPVQYLSWPRVATADETDPVLLLDVDGIEIAKSAIPTPLQHAQMEIALIELTEPVIGAEVSSAEAIKKKKVGPIEIEFQDFAPTTSRWPHIDMILAGLVPTGGASGGLDVVIGLTTEEINQSPLTFLDYTNFYISA